jgi:hypothetical protein
MKNHPMKTVAALTAGFCFTLGAYAADAKDTVASAIKALKDKGSYSWTTSTEMAGGQFPGNSTSGKVDKDGYILTTRQGQNGEVLTLTKGEKRVTKMDAGWQTPEEMAAAGGRGGFGGGFFGGGGGGAPADEAEALLKDIKELTANADGSFSADLTEQGAKDRAGFGGRGGRGGRGGAGGQGGFAMPEPTGAKGSVKFWVKDGVLSKYELTTSAKMDFQGQEMDLGRTMKTEVSAVGSTKVDAPEEAKKKLM